MSGSPEMGEHNTCVKYYSASATPHVQNAEAENKGERATEGTNQQNKKGQEMKEELWERMFSLLFLEVLFSLSVGASLDSLFYIMCLVWMI